MKIDGIWGVGTDEGPKKPGEIEVGVEPESLGLGEARGGEVLPEPPEAVAMVLRNHPEVLAAMERAIALVPKRNNRDTTTMEWRQRMREWLTTDAVIEYTQKLALTPGGKRMLQKLIDKAFASPQNKRFREDERPIRLILGVQGDGATINLGYQPMQVEVHEKGDE